MVVVPDMRHARRRCGSGRTVRSWLLALTWLSLACSQAGALADAGVTSARLAERVQQMAPLLDRYPPTFESDQQRQAVLRDYQALKSELDAGLRQSSNDAELLYLRGRLQRYGHNMDVGEAWLGATRDLRTALMLAPSHVPSLLELGQLWVYSWPALAPNAEMLLRSAQCHHGDEPLEPAQRGLFFALYFQNRLGEAARQIEYLRSTWPAREEYTRLQLLTRSDIGSPEAVAGAASGIAEKRPLSTTCPSR